MFSSIFYQTKNKYLLKIIEKIVNNIIIIKKNLKENKK